MISLPVLLLLWATSASAQTAKVGCTPVAAEAITAGELERAVKPLLRGAGTTVALLAAAPGVKWDLGEKRTARLSVYLTKGCSLGMTVSAVSGGQFSSPNVDAAVAELARLLRDDAPDWSLSTAPPNTIMARKGETVFSTDLRKLFQLRIDAGTAVALNGAAARVVFDDWLLFIVPENAQKAVNLSAKSSAYPWAIYDLTPYGLPRLVVRFDDGKAVLWSLP